MESSRCDGIYNFIKKLLVYIFSYEIITKMYLNEQSQDIWFYDGIRYLIQKSSEIDGNEFISITCMSDLLL